MRGCLADCKRRPCPDPEHNGMARPSCDDGREPLKPPDFTFAFPKTLPMMETVS